MKLDCQTLLKIVIKRQQIVSTVGNTIPHQLLTVQNIRRISFPHRTRILYMNRACSPPSPQTRHAIKKSNGTLLLLAFSVPLQGKSVPLQGKSLPSLLPPIPVCD
ncbi:unnamed protein product [Chrysodeixis includens]|uniref:Uncharacterized protein n=1 Tax=Chrysodeixis includens TaxID=689277 RepID=A0A9N8L1E2_CHRIL|nr:unnamed protein product [Chrysodeixis includens]